MSIQNDTTFSYLLESGRIAISGSIGLSTGVAVGYLSGICGVITNTGLYHVYMTGQPDLFTPLRQRFGNVIFAGTILMTAFGVVYVSLKVGRETAVEVYNWLK